MEKKILAAGMLSLFACYLLSAVLASLDSIKGTFDPTSAMVAIVGGQAARSK
jgi:hypothetical protein